MSITENSDSILAKLKEIDGPRLIDDWGGEIDQLLQQAHKLPAIYLVYGGAVFQPKQVMGNNIAEHADAWTVVVIAKSLRSKDGAAVACYDMIEAVREKLIGFAYGDGWLWPVSESLFFSGNGIQAYALEYTTDIETEDD